MVTVTQAANEQAHIVRCHACGRILISLFGQHSRSRRRIKRHCGPCWKKQRA